MIHVATHMNQVLSIMTTWSKLKNYSMVKNVEFILVENTRILTEKFAKIFDF